MADLAIIDVGINGLQLMMARIP